MLFIPIYSDQFRNAKRCVDAGFAEIISFHDISVQNLHEKLNMILEKNIYTHRVNLVSQQFRDNLVDPMEESIFWIEFVGRHKFNFPIFNPHSIHVPWYTYFYLDIIVFITIVVYIIFLLTKYGLKIIWRRFDAKNSIKEKAN